MSNRTPATMSISFTHETRRRLFIFERLEGHCHLGTLIERIVSPENEPRRFQHKRERTSRQDPNCPRNHRIERWRPHTRPQPQQCRPTHRTSPYFRITSSLHRPARPVALEVAFLKTATSPRHPRCLIQLGEGAHLQNAIVNE